MSTFIEALTEKDALTKNGAITNSTSHNFNLDLFFLAGACRNEKEKQIEKLLIKSYDQDRLKTLKIIFWAGDIRQGAGERRFFKLALNWLNKNHPNDIQDNINLIPEFSRWDVLFDLAMENEFIFSYILKSLVEKDNNFGLLCKWLPRKTIVTDKKKSTKNYNGKEVITVEKTKRLLHKGIAKKIQQRLNINEKVYRKMLVQGTQVVEQQMCAKKWNEINYSEVPSVAMNKYNKAWYRNDKERFEKYLEDVKQGKSKMNASVIFPSDIVKSVLTKDSYNWDEAELNEAQIVQWNSLPNYLENAEFNSFIPVCDTSGSMYGNPIAVSVGLGLYLSERNIGPFKDAFITFSENPQLQYLKGNINERLKQLVTSSWGCNTNLIKVFELILKKAQEANLSQNEMPKNILVISDMEFDEATSYYGTKFNKTNYEVIKQAYQTLGYNCPNIIFWNVNGRVGNVPITINNNGVALISGSSPNIINSVLTNDINPINVMNKIIESERYSVVH